MTDRGNPIDTRVLDQMIEDVGAERAHRLLRIFMGEARARMERVLAAATAGELTALRAECHTLKGSAGSFGAVAVEREANEIVAACRSGDTTDAVARAENLGVLVDAALGALDARLSNAKKRC